LPVVEHQSRDPNSTDEYGDYVTGKSLTVIFF
jgi:hypothetical protein